MTPVAETPAGKGECSRVEAVGLPTYTEGGGAAHPVGGDGQSGAVAAGDWLGQFQLLHGWHQVSNCVITSNCSDCSCNLNEGQVYITRTNFR